MGKTIEELVALGLATRLIAVILVFAYARHAVDVGAVGRRSVLRAIPFVLVAREVLFLILPFAYVVRASDAVILFLYARWISSRIGGERLVNLAAFVAALLLVTQIAARHAVVAPVAASAINLVVAFGSYAAFLVLVTGVRGVAADRAPEVADGGPHLLVGLLISHFAAAISGPDAVFSTAILYPLSHLVHLIPLGILVRGRVAAQDRDLATQHNTEKTLFDFMGTVGDAMMRHTDLDRILSYIVDTVVAATGAEAGAAFLVDEYEDVLRPRAVRGYFPPPYKVPVSTKTKTNALDIYFRSTGIALGETIIGEVAQSGTAAFVRDSRRDGRLPFNTIDEVCYINSLIALPLVYESRVYGVLSIILRKKTRLFSDSDFERARVFGSYGSLTLYSFFNYIQVLEKQEIEKEVSIAAEIQQKLLPERIPTISGAAVGTYTRPARGVSGDYFDVLPTGDRDARVALVVCDVAGKGVPASLVMVMIRTIIHLVASDDWDAGQVVRWINRGVAGNVDIERFATMSFLTYEPGTRRVSYANAAHHPAIVYRAADRRIEHLDTPGLPIGLEVDAPYEAITVDIEPSDIVLLYTDGIIEALNEAGEQFGYDRLSAALMKHAGGDANEVVQRIVQEVDTFVGRAKQHDDQTLIALCVE